MVDQKSPVEYCDLIVKGEHEVLVYCHSCDKTIVIEGSDVVERAKKFILENHKNCQKKEG